MAECCHVCKKTREHFPERVPEMILKENAGFHQDKKTSLKEAPWKKGGQNPKAEATSCRAYLAMGSSLDFTLQSNP